MLYVNYNPRSRVFKRVFNALLTRFLFSNAAGQHAPLPPLAKLAAREKKFRPSPGGPDAEFKSQLRLTFETSRASRRDRQVLFRDPFHSAGGPLRARSFCFRESAAENDRRTIVRGASLLMRISGVSKRE